MRKISLFILLYFSIAGISQNATGHTDRQLWVSTMIRIAEPVLENLSNNTLKNKLLIPFGQVYL